MTKAAVRPPRIPRSLLVQRFGALERAGLVERRPAGTGRGSEYHLTPAGEQLRPVVEALGDGSVTVEGRTDLRRASGEWMGLSASAARAGGAIGATPPVPATS